VIHAYGIVSLVESNLKLRRDVQLTLQELYPAYAVVFSPEWGLPHPHFETCS
jgi:hypothetical protein